MIMKRFLPLLFLFAFPLHAADRPDLVVIISIDQFRYDYLTRFTAYFAEDGFRRFLDRGADFTNAEIVYADTVTGAGHASIGTGYTPSATGVIGDGWFDRMTNRSVYCAYDPADGVSPVTIQTSSLGDRDQEAFPGAKVYGVAIKDRASILMAGRKATGAYWFDAKKQQFVSDSYYAADEALLASYNATLPAFLTAHPVWEQSSFIPAADLARITHDPEALRKFKTNPEGLGVSFPHPIHSLAAIESTPFGNAMTIGLAEELIEKEHAGDADGTPDILFLGLSSQDYLGHAYGPDSLEVADSVVRTDRDLADLFRFLDAHFAGRYTVALTADHGVQSIPEVARDMGRDAGRATLAKNPALPQDLIRNVTESSIYLDWDRIHTKKLDGERAKIQVRDAALKLNGVAAAFTNSQLMQAPAANASGNEMAVRRSFRADRSGDVIVVLKPGWIWNYNGTGTTHGQPVEADQHVPLLFWGNGISAGHFSDAAAPTDIARTIGALLGFKAGADDSRALPCVHTNVR